MSVWLKMGLNCDVRDNACPATNFPANALTAVWPFPKMSQAKPVRVAQSVQFGVFSIGPVNRTSG